MKKHFINVEDHARYTIFVYSPSGQCLNVTDNKHCFFFPFLPLRFPKMVAFANLLLIPISLLTQTSSLARHPTDQTSLIPLLPPLYPAIVLVVKLPTPSMGFLRKKHKEMAGCDCGLRNSRLVMLIKGLMSNKQKSEDH